MSRAAPPGKEAPGSRPSKSGANAKALKIPLVRWNQRAICIRLSDILKAEEAASV
jgi:hypothetical protein